MSGKERENSFEKKNLWIGIGGLAIAFVTCVLAGIFGFWAIGRDVGDISAERTRQDIQMEGIEIERTRLAIEQELNQLLSAAIAAPPGPTQTVISRQIEALEATRSSILESEAVGSQSAPTAIASTGESFAFASSFNNPDDDYEGWTLSDDSNLTNPGTGGSGGGANNGALIFEDVIDGASYFVAPDQYHTDWTGFSEIRFDLWSRGASRYVPDNDQGYVWLTNGFASAHYDLGTRPPENFTQFVVPLDTDVGWTFSGGASTLADVLINVDGFMILAEYGIGTQVDYSGLDNVVLVRR